jgi:hypothetical protein
MSEPYVAQLGRISGKLLSDNLIRHGVDLAFDNDLLYLKVSPRIPGSEQDGEDGDPNYDSSIPSSHLGTGIGINTESPAYDLDINSEISILITQVTSELTVSNVKIQTPNTFTTSVGQIEITPAGPNPTAVFDRLGFLDPSLNPAMFFNDNTIQTIDNRNINFNPNGTGTVQLQTNTNISGNLFVTGNINISGDLSKQGNLIIGDDVIDGEGNLPENDVLNLSAPISQHLLPGIDNGYDLGRDRYDSSPRRWSYVEIPDWTNIGTIRPESATISNQIRINGLANTIFATQSNEDILLDPDTGIVYIERTAWQDSDITNLNNTALRLASTGIGYTRFSGTNAILIPAGDTASRPLIPEVGDTRWNTELGYLECFDGTVYIISTGPGDVVDIQDMEDLGNIYSLILG